jgi:DNA-binding transcriptional LysR family regulator
MNLSSFDMNLLRVLDALLREGSTVAAGQRVGLSQPAVSAALGRLRTSLRDDLFVRQGQRLEPTDYARSLALPLRELLDRAEALVAGPQAFDPATAIERFRISGSDFFAEALMPDLGALVARVAPGIVLQMVDLVPENYVQSIERYEADIALVPRIDLPAWMAWEPLFNSSFVAIAREGHPALAEAGTAPGAVMPMDLFCGLEHILFSPEGLTRGIGDAALERAGRERRVVMTLPVFMGVCSAVAASERIALIPRQLADRVGGRMGLAWYRPPMQTPVPVIGMIWHRRATNAPAHRWLRARIAELMRPLNAGEPPLPAN